MQFFTSPQDLKGWVKNQESADAAANQIVSIVGNKDQQDIVDTCKAIFGKENDDAASRVLFEVLARYNITQLREGKMKDKLVKEAQMMRQDAVYSKMPLRICPKLPYSVGKRLISTYNCRHYCLDSITLDDDPTRVYCAEALWRRHIMDKFSREFKDKDGKWVGGYIRQRFQVFNDDGGNQMQLAHGERTRKPRPHQYSTERRLSEARGEKTYDLEASKTNTMVKLASADGNNSHNSSDPVNQAFGDIIEMKEAGLSNEDIIYKVAEHYDMTIPQVAAIYKLASKQLEKHDGVVYASDKTQMQKMAQSPLPAKTTLLTKQDMGITLQNGSRATLRMGTPVVIASDMGTPVFEIVDGPSTGQRFKLDNNMDISNVFVNGESSEERIQEGAEEVGLNDEITTIKQGIPPASNDQTEQAAEEFPILER